MAVATTCTVAPRKPPISSGIPSGSSTRVRICHSVMPWARAASTVAGSADSIAEYAPASRDGIARTTKASSGAVSPIPTSRANRVTSPRVGRARAAPAAATASDFPRPVWPTSRPSGIAIRAATATPSAV